MKSLQIITEFLILLHLDLRERGGKATQSSNNISKSGDDEKLNFKFKGLCILIEIYIIASITMVMLSVRRNCLSKLKSHRSAVLYHMVKLFDLRYFHYVISHEIKMK